MITCMDLLIMHIFLSVFIQHAYYYNFYREKELYVFIFNMNELYIKCYCAYCIVITALAQCVILITYESADERRLLLEVSTVS